MRVQVIFVVFLMVCSASDAIIHDLFHIAKDKIDGVKDTASNLIGGAKDKISDIKDSIKNVIDIAQFGKDFLWDNAFKPSLDIFVNSMY
jgi:hypothetical protein